VNEITIITITSSYSFHFIHCSFDVQYLLISLLDFFLSIITF